MSTLPPLHLYLSYATVDGYFCMIQLRTVLLLCCESLCKQHAAVIDVDDITIRRAMGGIYGQASTHLAVVVRKERK